MSAERKKRPLDIWDAASPKKRSGTMMRVDQPIIHSVEALADWRSSLFDCNRLAAQVLPGPTLSSRTALLQQYLTECSHDDIDLVLSTEWTVEGIVETLTSKLAGMEVIDECRDKVVFRVDPPEGEPWEILWALIGVDHLILDEPFRSLVDSSTYLVSDVLRFLMEARFVARETKDRVVVERFVTTFIRWMTGSALDKHDQETLRQLKIDRTVHNVAQRFDVLCFLLVAAAQNNVIGDKILTLDGLEYVSTKEHPALLDELHLLLVTMARWTRRGSFPLGVLIGWSASQSDCMSMRKQHPQLMQFLEAGLAWTR